MILRSLILRLLRHMKLVLGHLPGKRAARLVVFEGGAFLTAGTCFQASRAGKNQFPCENQSRRGLLESVLLFVLE